MPKSQLVGPSQPALYLYSIHDVSLFSLSWVLVADFISSCRDLPILLSYPVRHLFAEVFHCHLYFQEGGLLLWQDLWTKTCNMQFLQWQK